MTSKKILDEYRARLRPQLPPAEHDSIIGANLKTARRKTPLTQEDAAEILEVSAQKVARIERGEVRCSPEDLVSFCQLYDCTLAEILPPDMRGEISRPAGMDDETRKQLRLAIDILNGLGQ